MKTLHTDHTLEYEHLGPFVVHVWLKKKHMPWERYAARPVRKGVHWIKPMELPEREHTQFVACTRKINYWVAVCFMIGASLFSVPGFLPERLSSIYNVVYFCGSIFFTTAAYLQLIESINKDITNPDLFQTQYCHWIRAAWRPRSLGYCSSLVQFSGTVCFNVNCFDALVLSEPLAMDIGIWTPGMAGSVCFLVSCLFAWMEIARDAAIIRFKSVAWWIVWVNIAGSVAFQISSAVAFYRVATGEQVAPVLAMVTLTFGGVCFFIGAFLLRVEDMLDAKKLEGAMADATV
ncbi:MAG: hypothetical protein MI749_16760 [Desulfovibrionales bacterium]|nr:hypothetical protein [Desulfovibrionales bacterium]